MTYAVKEVDSVTVKPDRDIVATIANEFKMYLENLITEGAKHIIIDFDEIEMVDSVGLGVLISIHNELRKESGQLTVCNLSNDIFALFRTMRLNQHFEVLAKKQ